MSDTPEAFATILDLAGEHLQSTVVAVEEISGGYTPQILRRLTLADGRCLVLKAAAPNDDPDAQPFWPDILRREIAAYCDIPILEPWRPEFFGAFDHDEWAVLLIEDLSKAERVPPWTPDAIDTVARGLAEMHHATLGGSRPPAAHPPFRVPPFFTRIQERGHVTGDLPSSWNCDDWWHWLDIACDTGDAALNSHRDESARCVIHFDVRSDNLFIRDGRMVLIDWPDPTWESPAMDSVYWALGIAVEEGVPAMEVHEHYLRYAGQLSDAEIRWALAFIAGFFLERIQGGMQPTPHVADLRWRFLLKTLPWFAEVFELPTVPEFIQKE